mmetsp:Transcript_67519/g.161164  ORF Transcript_67519/g.161164 Transcript_67519/m.161164 type:complete len:80 (-) Transcript_67519:267-506(-)
MGHTRTGFRMLLLQTGVVTHDAAAAISSSSCCSLRSLQQENESTLFISSVTLSSSPWAFMHVGQPWRRTAMTTSLPPLS